MRPVGRAGAPGAARALAGVITCSGGVERPDEAAALLKDSSSAEDELSIACKDGRERSATLPLSS